MIRPNPTLLLFLAALLLGGWVLFGKADKDWVNVIKEHGGVAAYETLAKELMRVDESEQHRIAHNFGKALYEAEGLAGFPVCDQSFNGGCGHEFMAHAVADQGIEVLTALNRSCLDRFGNEKGTSCQHGLGHGLVAHFGYTIDGLSKALEMCNVLHTDDPRKGCRGGAFMEYNLHTVADTSVRPFDPTEATRFCRSFTGGNSLDCIFWIPQWMLTSEHPGERTNEVFKDVGLFCEASDSPADCFEGLGYFATPSAHFKREGARAFCDASSDDLEYREHCWKFAAIGDFVE